MQSLLSIAEDGLVHDFLLIVFSRKHNGVYRGSRVLKEYGGVCSYRKEQAESGIIMHPANVSNGAIHCGWLPESIGRSIEVE